MNMESLIEKMQKAKRGVHLPDKRREFIRGRLVQFMHADAAIRERGENRRMLQTSSRSPFGVFRRLSVMFVALLMGFLGVGTSFAAQGSLPGELLYPVKVGFTEKLGAAVQLTDTARATYETKLAERRLEEAAVLAAEGSISAGARADVESRFEKHADRAKQNIERVETDGDVRVAAELASDLEAALRIRGAVLGKIAKVREESRNEVKSLESSVRTKLDGTIQLRQNLETRVSESDESDNAVATGVQSAAELRVRAAEQAVKRVRGRFDSEHASLSAETRAEVSAKIEAADRAAVEARAKLTAGAYAEALKESNASLRDSHQAEVLLKSGIRLDLRLKLLDSDDSRTKSEDSSADADRSNDNWNDDGTGVRGTIDANVTSSASSSRGSGSGSIKGDLDLNLRLGR